MLRQEREKLGLKPVTIGQATARRISALIDGSGLDTELWSRIPRNMAITEARFGVSAHALLCGKNAEILFESFVDSAWTERRREAATVRVQADPDRESFDAYCLRVIGRFPVAPYEPRYESLMDGWRRSRG